MNLCEPYQTEIETSRDVLTGIRSRYDPRSDFARGFSKLFNKSLIDPVVFVLQIFTTRFSFQVFSFFLRNPKRIFTWAIYVPGRLLFFTRYFKTISFIITTPTPNSLYPSDLSKHSGLLLPLTRYFKTLPFKKLLHRFSFYPCISLTDRNPEFKVTSHH